MRHQPVGNVYLRLNERRAIGYLSMLSLNSNDEVHTSLSSWCHIESLMKKS